MAATSKDESKSMAPFFVIWTGQAVSLFGSQLVQFSLIWWLTQETGSATALAGAALVGLLPQVLLGPFAGTLVDRWNRRITMMAADALVAGATAVLAILFMTGMVEIWQVYAALFARSLAGSFHWPAMAASTSLMVPERHLTRVQGLNQMLQGGLNIASAPLAALLIGIVPIQTILGIDFITAAVAILSLLFIHVPQPRRDESKNAGDSGANNYWSDMRDGFRYIWDWPGLVAILLLAMLINLVINPAFTLLPLLVTGHFGGEAIQLAWLESALGIGVVVGGLGLGIWGGFRRRIVTSLVGLILLGIGVSLLGLVPSGAFLAAIGAIFIVGLMIPVVNGPMQAVIQASVAPEMQGRVFALVGSAASAMSPLGMVVTGPIADLIGIQAWLVGAGLVTGLAGVVAFFIPAVMQIEDRRPEESVLHNEEGPSVEPVMEA